MTLILHFTDTHQILQFWSKSFRSMNPPEANNSVIAFFQRNCCRICENVRWADIHHVLGTMKVWLPRRKNMGMKSLKLSHWLFSWQSWLPITTLPWNTTISSLCSCLWDAWLGNSADFGWAWWGGSPGLSCTLSHIERGILMDGGQLAFSWHRMSLAAMTGLIHLCPKCLYSPIRPGQTLLWNEEGKNENKPDGTSAFKPVVISHLPTAHWPQQFYGQPLTTLLSCRADRHWHGFRVWRSHLHLQGGYHQKPPWSSLDPRSLAS